MVKDNSDRMVELLEAIALSSGVSAGEINIDRSQSIGVTRELSRGYVIQETADMDEDYITSDGAARFESGEQQAIVRLDVPSGHKVRVYAVGASDHADMRYGIRADEQRWIGGWTESPLGTVNNVFSFVESFGSYIEATDSIEYVGWYTGTSGSTVDAVGRLHVEVVPE